MKELVTRTIFGLLYAAVVIGGIYFHPFALLALMVIIYVAGLTEMKHLTKGAEHGNLFNTAALLGVFILWAHLSFAQEFQNHLMPFSAFMFMVLFLQHLFTKGSEESSLRLQNVIFSVVYLFIPTSLAISIAFINGLWEPRFLLGLFFVLWANDTAAYLTGMAIGKHKLIPRLSPKKSIEGLVGGLLGSLLIGYLLSLFWPILSVEQWLIFSVITAIGGVVGDLFQSSLKRAAGVKDSGNLIPGHGGILDRLDSFLISAPIVYFYLLFFT